MTPCLWLHRADVFAVAPQCLLTVDRCLYLMVCSSRALYCLSMGLLRSEFIVLLCHIQEYLSALVMHHFYFPLHYFCAFEFFPSSDDCWDIYFFFFYLGHTRHSVESALSWFDSASLIFILIGHFQVETADASQKESLCSRLHCFITLHAGPQIKTCEIC